MPVLEFPYTQYVLDDVVMNMCLGMGGQNQVILTYSATRNDGGKCKGCCPKTVVVPSGPYAGDPTSCDEFPFASTYEALNQGAHLACVNAYENNFQGWWIMQWRRATGIQDGTQYIAKVTGFDCSKVIPTDVLGCGGVPGGTIVRRSIVMRDNTLTITGSESMSSFLHI